MYRKIVENYRKFADELQCPILPSGTAIQYCREKLQFRRDENFDYENPTPTALPEQSKSLNVGYYWLTGNTPTGKAELRFDPRHLNKKGCYIANAVFFEILTGKSIFDNSFRPEDISEDELKLFRESAHRAVQESAPELDTFNRRQCVIERPFFYILL